MSCREQSDSDGDLAGAVIDSLKFAAEEGCITGRLALTQLTRLSDVLTRREGWLECRLEGCRREIEGESRPCLHLHVAGRLGLRCQRCLAEVEFDCVIDSRLLLIPPGTEWPEEELETDDYDAIPASRELSVLALIEDEVLLALPIVPRHADCQPPGSAAGLTGADGVESEPSPFAALANLKKH